MRSFRDYVHKRPFIYKEMNFELADKVATWKGKLPFNNLFGDKERIVIPFVSEYLNEIKKKILDIKDPKTNQPKYSDVDLEKGTVITKGKTPQGRDFTRETKIGKVLQKEFGENGAKLWNDAQGSSYSIIVSRAPIDVLRMSDHSGIESCHSQGGEYFQCAIGEARAGGPIAYLVKTNDLNKIPDLQADEIFEDDEREVEGIVPVARIRIRRLVRKDGSYELAIPEAEIYGQKISGFQQSVDNWTKSQQKNVLDNNPKGSDFNYLGGSYEDNSSNFLLNRILGRNSSDPKYDYANINHIEDPEESKYVIDKRYNDWKEKLEAINVPNFEHDIQVGATVVINDDLYEQGKLAAVKLKTKAIVVFNFAKSDFNKLPKNEHEIDVIKDAVIHTFNNYPIERENVKVHLLNNYIGVHIEFNHLKIDDPDDYDNFVNNKLFDIDHNWEYFKNEIKQEIYIRNKKIVKPSLYNTIQDKIAKGHFKNFKVIDTYYGLIFTSTPFVIGDLKELTPEQYPSAEGKDNEISRYSAGFLRDFNGLFQKFLIAYLIQGIRRERMQQYLPGIGKPSYFESPFHWWTNQAKFKFFLDQKGNISTNINFELNRNNVSRGINAGNNQELIATEKYIKYIDDNFEFIQQKARELFTNQMKPKFIQRFKGR